MNEWIPLTMLLSSGVILGLIALAAKKGIDHEQKRKDEDQRRETEHPA
jgi:hypothetical protein